MGRPRIQTVIEVTAESAVSFEDAVGSAIDAARARLPGLREARVTDQRVVFRDRKPDVFRVTLLLKTWVAGFENSGEDELEFDGLGIA